jgi:hypothetical protein
MEHIRVRLSFVGAGISVLCIAAFTSSIIFHAIGAILRNQFIDFTHIDVLL